MNGNIGRLTCQHCIAFVWPIGNKDLIYFMCGSCRSIWIYQFFLYTIRIDKVKILVRVPTWSNISNWKLNFLLIYNNSFKKAIKIDIVESGCICVKSFTSSTINVMQLLKFVTHNLFFFVCSTNVTGSFICLAYSSRTKFIDSTFQQNSQIVMQWIVSSSM